MIYLLLVLVFGCDPSVQNHIYHPERLRIIEPCKTVTGTLTFVRKEKDGDEHWRLKLDPGQGGLLDRGNKGELVIEPICVNRVTQVDAVKSCKDFHQRFPEMKVGAHVQITGSYVEDIHHGWREIHPPTSVQIK